MRFEGKVAVITGGAGGIGLAFGLALVREGAAVAILDLDEAAGAEAVAQVEAAGGRVMFRPCDVTDEAQVDRAAADVIAGFGGIDILIPCAAKHLAFYNQAPTKLPREHWRLMLDVNIVGVVNCAAACRDSMRERGGGVILNISSIASIMLAGAYGVSKLAVRGLTVSLAKELAADNIRVVGVAPGWVDSPAAIGGVAADYVQDLIQNQQLIKRPGRMEDIVKAMLYLCSDDASFVTGETIVVGGGFPLRA
jgi:NAD(P)-dependent dehydrogenase (short-subunit alcohol dehydrogenase family)